MKLNCLCCGHKIDLDDAYDDYAGQVKCYACGGILEIKTDEGKIKSIVLADGVRREPLRVGVPSGNL